MIPLFFGLATKWLLVGGAVIATGVAISSSSDNDDNKKKRNSKLPDGINQISEDQVPAHIRDRLKRK